MFSFKAEGFFWLERPLWIGISKLQFLIRISIQPKMLDPDPDSMDQDPKH
jgi:hypothetical protein